MKKMFLILSILFIVTNCSEKVVEQQNELQTENATIYYDASEIDNCIYTIKTESNNFYSVKSLNETFRENNLKVKISYTKTNERINCGFSNNLTVIELESIERI